MKLRIICFCYIILLSTTPVMANWIEDSNWRRIVNFSERDIDGLSDREVARLKAGSQVGLLQFCGGQLSAVLVDINDTPFVFTNRHGAINFSTSELYCDEATYQKTLRYLPDFGLLRHNSNRARRSVGLAWPPINITGSFLPGGDYDNVTANDWIVFRLAEDARDPRLDDLPFRLGGEPLKRGGMAPVRFDTEQAVILPGTLIAFAGDYDKMQSVFTIDCEMNQGGIQLDGRRISVISHQCDSYPGSSGGAIAIYDPERTEFQLQGLHAASLIDESRNTQDTYLNLSNQGVHISGILARMYDIPYRVPERLRYDSEMPKYDAWPPQLPPPPDERHLDRLASSKNGKSINIRSGLGTDTEIKGQLEAGQYMVARDCLVKWCEVSGLVTTKSGQAYVEGFAYQELLKLEVLPADKQRPYHFKGGEKVVVIGNGDVSLYDQDGLTGEAILKRTSGYVQAGDELWVRECSVNYCAVFGKYNRFNSRAVLRGSFSGTGQLATQFGIKAISETLLISRENIRLE